MRARLPLVLLALVACTPADTVGQVVVLPNVTIIDGTGAAPRPGMTIVVRGDRIAEIHPADGRAVPAGARVLDVSGAYVTPGLIDSHVHMATFDRSMEFPRALLRFALLGGVTTVRDMGGNVERLAELATAARDPSSESPRVYYSAVVAGPEWFSTYDPERLRYWSGTHAVGRAPGVREVADTTNLAALVRGAASLGVHGIKAYSDITPGQLALLAAEARRQGLRVWGHAVVPPGRSDQVVAAGVEVVSHADQLIWAAAPPGTTIGDRAARSRLMRSTPPDGPAMTALLDSMRARGTLFEPTLLIMQLDRIGSGSIAPLDTVPAWSVAVTRHAHARGVAIVAGTDAIGRQTPNIQAELEILVSQVGMTPLEAIRAATERGAQALGIADSTGTITTGKWADLLVLRADPTVDIGNTRSVRYVLRGGRVHGAAAPEN